MSKDSGILGRYAIVLEALAAAPDGLSLTELIDATGLPRATTHRLVQALLGVGYAAQRDGRKVYVLGPRLLRLLHMGIDQAAVAALVQPLLEELAGRFGETAFLAKLSGSQVRSVAMALPEADNQSYVQPGREMPLHAAASAKAIFAFQDDSLLAEALAQPRPRYTATTRTSEAEVLADLDQVRCQGYALCEEELDPGVFSYACPVHLEEAGVIYSIGMVGLTPRLHGHGRAKILAALRGAADEVGSLLRKRVHRPVLGEVAGRSGG
jgi:DNA-binding IclR family transcriptional regulator